MPVRYLIFRSGTVHANFAFLYMYLRILRREFLQFICYKSVRLDVARAV